MGNDILYFVKEVGTTHRTKDLHLPDAMSRLTSWTSDLPRREDMLRLSWDDLWTPDDPWLLPDDLFKKVAERLKDAKPGVDAFIRGDGKQTIRIKTIQDLPEAPSWSGASQQLSNFLDAAWAEFPGGFQNWGIHLERKIYGSTLWSQHSWDDAVDMGVGNDKRTGDDIHRWSKSVERKHGGYCENIWWETPSTGDATQDHRDHGHRSLAPCHTGTPPGA
jgi:hypothetical protein